MSFNTTSQLKARVAAQLKKASTELADYWDTIVEDALNAAYNEIVTVLSSRGYSSAQIADWDRGGEFEKDIGLFWALTKGAGLTGEDDRWINKLDRRKELETVSVTIDGEVVDPATAGDIGTGSMDTSWQTFTWNSNRDGTVEKTSW